MQSGFLIVALYLAFQATALVFAMRAMRTARTSQGAAAWVVFLLALPYLAVPFFLFLGNWRFRGYLVARRQVKDIAERIREQSGLHRTGDPAEDQTIRAFEAIAGLPVTQGNDLALLVDGAQTFDAIFEALDAATDYALVQFYILRDDRIGRAFQARLIACARRGVRVRLLYDAVGCYNLPRAYLEALHEAGVETFNVHARSGPKTRFQINFRNHRKTVVVDGHTGFLGGLNVGDEYMSRDAYFGHWRDTHCRITGPMVSQLQVIFAEDWYWATGENLREALIWDAPAAPAGRLGLISATGPADPDEYGTLFFCNAIRASHRRLWIATPYMVPENDILVALKLAALRGVDVRLLVPDKRDHWLPWLAAFAYFDELTAAGIGIYRYTDGFMHQKVVLVDDDIAAIGTANLDNRSCRLNFEAMAVVFDSAVAGRVAGMLEADFARAYRLEQTLDERAFFERTAAPVARLFAPLL